MLKIVVALVLLVGRIKGQWYRSKVNIDEDSDVPSRAKASNFDQKKALASLFFASHVGARVLPAGPSRVTSRPIMPKWLNRGISKVSRARVAQASMNLESVSELAKLRLHVALAKMRLESENSREAHDELTAAERKFTAYELEHPSAALAGAIESKASTAHRTSDSREAWRLRKLVETNRRLEKAVATITRAALEGDARNATLQQHISGSLAELYQWTVRGSYLAEQTLLVLLKTWMADRADRLLRKAWSTTDELDAAFDLSKAQTALQVGDAVRALSIYDRLCEDVAPNCAEAWHQRGLCLHLSLEQHEEAAQSFERALSLNPYRYPTMLAFAKLLMRERSEAETVDLIVARQARAYALLDEAVSINPSLQLEAQVIKSGPAKSHA